MTKIILICLLVLLVPIICYATDTDSGYGTLIAVEIRVNNKFSGIIGKLEYTGETIDLVTFQKGLLREVIVLPEVCQIIEKTINSEGVHHIKCRNQYGTIASGTIDFHDRVAPKITLVRESGHVITNISQEGKKLQKEYIPKITLGQ